MDGVARSAMFVRIVFALLVVVMVIMAMRYLRRAVDERRRPPALDARTVRCAHCQVYLPRDDAVAAHGKVYCSPEHAAQDQG